MWSDGYESGTAGFSFITARYAHFTRDLVRKAAERVAISITADILDRSWPRTTESASPEALCGRIGARRSTGNGHQKPPRDAAVPPDSGRSRESGEIFFGGLSTPVVAPGPLEYDSAQIPYGRRVAGLRGGPNVVSMAALDTLPRDRRDADPDGAVGLRRARPTVRRRLRDRGR